MEKAQELTPKQLEAIELILQGKTDREVSELVGVSRVTINTWKNQTAIFVAELNSRKAVIVDKFKDQQLDTVKKAYEILDKVLTSELEKDEPDATVALQVVKNIPIELKRIETDPLEIEANISRAETFRNI